MLALLCAREYFPLLGYKFATRDALEASGLEYTYMVTGGFIETQVGQ